ncbi:MAG: CopG family transcriptional regulator [Methanomicrobiales archaeon]|nr:CopG family transcriptional regulator [Methanomicrobiales archaeon]MDI6875649.1 CopG family transcriptional regulator [Methanomicrobiales archaeon]
MINGALKNHSGTTMRFSISIPDDEVTVIDEEARKSNLSRSEWIHRAVHQVLTAGAPAAPPPAPLPEPGELEVMKVQLAERDLMITELKRDKTWLQGQLALLNERLPPLLSPPKESLWEKIAFWRRAG